MNMKITISQLRKIIREEVEKEMNTGKCPKCDAKVQLTSNGLISYHDYKNPLGDSQNCPGSQNKPVKESKGFDDYVRDVDRDMPTSWDSPDPQDVHDEFLMWRDRNGEVPLEKLASELGVNPKNIDWNGTGLRVINGIVTELL